MTKLLRPEEFDWHVAVALGLGMSMEQAAEFLNVSRETVNSHVKKRPEFFQINTGIIKAIKATHLSGAFIEAQESAKERIGKIMHRGLKITENVLDKAEALGDAATLSEAMEIHRSITMWASKMFVSEAPKELKVKGEVEHTHHLVPAGFFDQLQAVMKETRSLPAHVIEAEIVHTN